jgi:hypothetical protein
LVLDVDVALDVVVVAHVWRLIITVWLQLRLTTTTTQMRRRRQQNPKRRHQKKKK